MDTSSTLLNNQSNSVYELRYQPALPISNGRLAMLLFLSTEIMFFTAILGAYIVLRFPQWQIWPTQEQVHVELWIGVLNTVILFGSCISLWLTTRRAAVDQTAAAKFWLLMTIGLAVAFLGVKGYEYYTKFENGLYPNANAALIYDSADQNYLSQTVEQFRKITSDLDAGVQSSSDDAKLETLNLIRLGVVEWTQHKVGSASDRAIQKQAIEAMAHQILPLEVNEEAGKYLVEEINEVRIAKQQLQARLEQAESQLKTSQANLRELTPGKEADAESRAAFADESQKAEDLTDKIGDIRREMIPLKNRLSAVDALSESHNGINQTYGIKLPFVMPAGKAWANTYFLLTGFHLLHLIVGLGVLLFWMFVRFDKNRVPWLKNFGLYWHFVDLVWLVIFVIVYLT